MKYSFLILLILSETINAQTVAYKSEDDFDFSEIVPNEPDIPNERNIPKTPDDNTGPSHPDSWNVIHVEGLPKFKRIGHKGWQAFLPEEYEFTNEEIKLLRYLWSRQDQPCLSRRTQKFFSNGGSGFICVTEDKLEYYKQLELINPFSGNVENYEYVSAVDLNQTGLFYSNDWRYIKEPVGLSEKWLKVFWNAALKSWVHSCIRNEYNEGVNSYYSQFDEQFLALDHWDNSSVDLYTMQRKRVNRELLPWFERKINE